MLNNTIQLLKENSNKRNDQFQPTVIIIGSLAKIKKAYIVFNDIKYLLNDVVEAIDTVFQIFFALDCKYPHCSQQIWQFLQRAAFNIKLPLDKLSVSVSTLLGYFERQLTLSVVLNNQ